MTENNIKDGTGHTSGLISGHISGHIGTQPNIIKTETTRRVSIRDKFILLQQIIKEYCAT